MMPLRSSRLFLTMASRSLAGSASHLGRQGGQQSLRERSKASRRHGEQGKTKKIAHEAA